MEPIHEALAWQTNLTLFYPVPLHNTIMRVSWMCVCTNIALAVKYASCKKEKLFRTFPRKHIRTIGFIAWRGKLTNFTRV